LHGDLTVANLGRRIDGQLVVFDASGLRGDPSFDAARWRARLAPPALDPKDLLDAWTEIEPRLLSGARDINLYRAAMDVEWSDPAMRPAATPAAG
jgi:hypothetical protein